MSILKEANTIIYGDREKTYGHPSKNLETIATMWTARLANNPDHRDSLVDICGYAALIERCDEAPTTQEQEE